MKKTIQTLTNRLLSQYPDLGSENSRFRATICFVRSKGKKFKAIVKFTLGTFISEGTTCEEAGKAALGLADARLTLDCGG